MSLHSWLQNLRSALAGRPDQREHSRHGSLRAVTHRPNLEVLEDRLTPSFSPATSFPAGVAQNPQAMVAGDFNNDGHFDLVSAYHAVNVDLGNADGTFQGVDVETGIDAVSVAAGDFTADGNLDLVVWGETFVFDPYDDAGGHYEVRTEVLLGNGDGTFQDPYLLDIGEPVVVGDFNNDGTLDLGVVAYQGFPNPEVAVLLGNGDGSFSDPITSVIGLAGDSGYGVATDINGDGKLDMVIDGWSMLGDGSGHLSRAGAPFFPDYTSVAFGDVNGDGKIDVVKAHASNNTVSVQLANGLGGFAPAQNFAVGAGPESVVLGDFNGDGWLDVGTASSSDHDSLLINDGNWTPPPPSLQIGDVSVREGNTGTIAANFNVTLSAPSPQTITVAYATGNGFATAGSDYQAASGTLTFAPGETSKSITVSVIGDRLAEANETFFVNLSSPTSPAIADGQGQGTILDDEPRISIGDATKLEGSKNHTTQFTFTVTLSAAYDQSVTMSFRTVDGTAKTSDSDYVAKIGTLTFAPGETTKTITIVVNGDSKKEADETFYLDLFGNSSNSLFTKQRGIGTILNDD